MKSMERDMEKIEKAKDVINIGLKAETETERMLSNFAHAPFDLDGKHYGSVEGFWQSLKFPEDSEEREEVANLIGGKAKRAGKKVGEVVEIEYQGERIKVGSSGHHELMKKAIKAKLEQNPNILKLLLDTGDKKITHIFKAPDGKVLPDSKAIPGKIFSQILMDLREEFKKEQD